MTEGSDNNVVVGIASTSSSNNQQEQAINSNNIKDVETPEEQMETSNNNNNMNEGSSAEAVKPTPVVVTKTNSASDLAPINEDGTGHDDEGLEGGGNDDKAVSTTVADADHDNELQGRIQEMELLALNCSIDPAGWLDKQKSENSITGSAMSQAGCALYAVSSQKQDVANRLYNEWKLTNFKAVVGDPNNSLAHYLKKNPEYFPELRIVDTQKGSAHPFLNRKRYPIGAVGPAVFFMVNDKPVLGWSSRPKLANGAGSMNRPDPDAMWTQVSIMAQCVREGKDMDMNDGSGLPMAAGCGEIMKSLCTIL